ncbi:MAG: ABC transporter permease [Planctomycetota bacterium]
MAWTAVVTLTYADSVRQPTLWLATAVGLGFLVLTTVFGMFNFFEQDRFRLFCTAGVAITMLNGVFLAPVLGASAVSEELSDRTALTLFAKPLGRGAYLVGKTLGVWAATVSSSAVLAGAHLGLLAWLQRHGFPGDHHHSDDPAAWAWVPYTRLILAHFLGTLTALSLATLGIVLALRLRAAGAITACFAAFVGANVLAGIGLPTTVILPALAIFQIDDALQFRRFPIEPDYFGLCVVHSLLYSSGCLLLGLSLFKRQDLA